MLDHRGRGARQPRRLPALRFFVTLARFGGFPAAIAPVLLSLAVVSCSLRSSGRPDVILITIDTLRADRLGCYGDARARTPNLDRLASEGILFESADTPVPVTLPSHSTILTGLLPPHHGVRNNGSYALPPDVPTLAERFRAEGYRTGGFVSAFVLNRQFGIARGFDAYDDSLVTERAGTRTVERALRWLDSGADKKGKRSNAPVFLWVHLYEPHTPWTPPPPYLTMPLASGYDKEVAAADGAAGQLIEHLRKSGRLDGAIVAVLGDHGEGLNDHGEMEHGIFLYRETVHVPWILRLPKAREAGRKVSDLVSTADLAPTLCGLAGIKPLPATDGLSLEPCLEGRPLAARPGLYLETLFPQENYGWAPLFGWQTPEWKWIRAPEAELYNLKEDPGEKTNLAGQGTGSGGAQASAPNGEVISLCKRSLGEVEATARKVSTQQVSPEVMERLRSLGYVSAGGIETGSPDALPDPKRMISVQADLESAKRLMDHGDFSRALDPFRRVLAANGENTVALLGLGRALNQTGRCDEAEVILRRAVRLRPGNTTAMAGLADALFGQGRWNEAASLYRLCEADVTQGPQMRGREITCEAMQGNSAAARQALQKGAAAYPNWAKTLDEVLRQAEEYRSLAGASADSVRLNRAVAAANLGMFSESRKILDGSFSPASRARRLRIIENLMTALQRPDEALACRREARGGEPASPRDRIKDASLELDAGRADKALRELDAVLAVGAPDVLQGSELAAAQYDRCQALVRLGRRDEAILALDAAVRAGFSDLSTLLTDPDLDPLRDHPRLLELVDQISRTGHDQTDRAGQ